MSLFEYGLELSTITFRLASSSRCDGKPPSKKRKIQDDRGFLDPRNPAPDVAKFLVMCRLTVEFKFSDALRNDELMAQCRDDALPSLLSLALSYFPYHNPPIFKIKTVLADIELGTLCFGDYNPLINFIGTIPSVHELSEKDPISCYRAQLRKNYLNDSSLFLDIDLLWKNSIHATEKVSQGAKDIFARYFPGGDPSVGMGKWYAYPDWSPSEFYDNVHVPTTRVNLSLMKGYDSVRTPLFPFQERAVAWLLEREGLQALPDGSLRPFTEKSLPVSFAYTTDVEGRSCLASRLHAVIISEPSQWPYSEHLKGGILAEEMGLGKTVEMLALICLHKRPHSDLTTPDPTSTLLKSGATLIVTPSAILEQWKQEITKHAPSLRFMHYRGIQKSVPDGDVLAETLASCDVVLTTYDVLQKEIHYAQPPPDRSLRHRTRLPRRKSPLVLISWWRVCIDEAQMVERVVNSAARVARMIPRCNAWAVTGTPLRKDEKDLFGLLVFLQCEPFCDKVETWTRMCRYFKSDFKVLIKRLVLRHNKELIRDELHLPRQKRVVITMPFTAVEEQHYEQLFQQMCDECGFDAQGGPVDPHAQRPVEKMRSWLIRLRNACLHPQVGRGGKRTLGGGPLRSVLDVLETMIDQNDTQIHSEERNLLISQLRRGQLCENAEEPREALVIWTRALSMSQGVVEHSRKQLAEVLNDLKVENYDDMSVSDTDDEESEEVKARVGIVKLRLRSALEIEHMCRFFIASAYFQIKSNGRFTQPDSEKYKKLNELEEQNYEMAKHIRREMLSETTRRVNKHIDVVRERTKQGKLVQIPPLSVSFRPGGIESQRIIAQLEDLTEELNEHVKQLIEWRDHLVKLILRPLVDEDEDNAKLEGDEYESSTKVQDEMYAYMEAMRGMVAAYHDAITGQKNVLVIYDLEKDLEKARNGKEPCPELVISLVNTYKRLKPRAELGSVRGILNDLRTLVTALEWQESGGSSRARTEHTLLDELHTAVSTIFSTHSKVATKLEREIVTFQSVTNRRLEYYKQLQQISDTVAPYNEQTKGQTLDINLFDIRLIAEKKMQEKLSGLKSKRRYFLHLREDVGNDESTRICAICQSSFEQGVLTVCGHKYCKDCLRYWWRQHHSCPTCKTRLRSNELHDITYKPSELVVQEEKTTGPVASDHSMKNAIYSNIKSADLREIKDIEIHGSFGTKIDTLARHLIWLRHHDPGAKAIVFSQYKSFLLILANAFRGFKIGFSSIDSPDGIERFKEDPAIECFLLHANAHSSGLNLVNATHVFLCEPLINTAIELQAIARVHRIGQYRETTVWMYLISDSIEESIYQISVSRRLAHIAQKRKQISKSSGSLPSTTNGFSELTENDIDVANSLEMQDAAFGKLLSGRVGEGENVGDDDLWQCLFGKVRKGEAEGEHLRPEIDRMLRAEAAEGRANGET